MSRKMLLLAVLVLGSVAVALYYFKQPGGPPAMSGQLQLSSDGRFNFIRLVSTDGRKLALDSFFSIAGNINTLPVGGGKISPIDVPYRRLLGSTFDGSRLLFMYPDDQVEEGEGQLWSTDPDGHSPVRFGKLVGHAGTWSPDGKTLVFAKGNELDLVRKSDGNAEKIATFPEPVRALKWSPDGETLRMSVGDVDLSKSALWQMPATGGSPERFLPQWISRSRECCGTWSPDGKYFVFQNEEGIWALREGWKFPGLPPTLPVKLADSAFSSPLFSQDGKKLFLVKGRARGQLLLFDRSAWRFTSYLNGISAQFVSFSKDGQWAAYVSYPELTVWRSKLDGSERLQLSQPGLRAFMPRWSPDGKEIAFFAATPNFHPWRIFKVASSGGTPEPMLPDAPPGDQGEMSWSPDGRSVAYAELGGAPDKKIHIFDRASRLYSELPGSEGCYFPIYSSDGKYLAAIRSSTRSIMLNNRTTGQWTELVRGTEVRYIQWSKDDKSIFFMIGDPMRIDSSHDEILVIDVSSGKMAGVVNLNTFKSTGTFGIWFGLTPDDAPLMLGWVEAPQVYSFDFLSP